MYNKSEGYNVSFTRWFNYMAKLEDNICAAVKLFFNLNDRNTCKYVAIHVNKPKHLNMDEYNFFVLQLWRELVLQYWCTTLQ